MKQVANPLTLVRFWVRPHILKGSSKIGYYLSPATSDLQWCWFTNQY